MSPVLLLNRYIRAIGYTDGLARILIAIRAVVGWVWLARVTRLLELYSLSGVCLSYFVHVHLYHNLYGSCDLLISSSSSPSSHLSSESLKEAATGWSLGTVSSRKVFLALPTPSVSAYPSYM